MAATSFMTISTDDNNPGGSYTLIYPGNTYTGGYSANQGWQMVFAIYPVPVPSG